MNACSHQRSLDVIHDHMRAKTRTFGVLMFIPIHKELIADFVAVQATFGIGLPSELCERLKALGSGYSARKELLFFGNESSSRDLIEWNNFIVECGIYPPSQGGPLFIVENCVGVQFGVRRAGNTHVYLAFDPNTFKALVIAETADDFINALTNDMESVSLGIDIAQMIDSLGEVKPGYNFAPYVSPLLGGSADPTNWSLAPVKARMTIAVKEFYAIRNS
ncbi:SMI1/KNR4 family protein [Massilia sp. H-1]|nr:SMI1/KNR4 family protein [Massilia sp. H-1]